MDKNSYKNKKLMSFFYNTKNISYDYRKIEDDSNILMLGMGSLILPDLLPNCNFTVIEYDDEIIEEFSDKITERITIVKGDAYNIDIEGRFDYLFIDIFVKSKTLKELIEVEDLYLKNVDRDKMFHLKSVFKNDKEYIRNYKSNS